MQKKTMRRPAKLHGAAPLSTEAAEELREFFKPSDLFESMLETDVLVLEEALYYGETENRLLIISYSDNLEFPD